VAARFATVGGAIGLCALLVAIPEVGLTVWWGLVAPLLPLVWFVAPGLWRNICPLAALNQTPRVLGFSRAGTPPRWWGVFATSIGMVAFLAIVVSRPIVFNDSGPATAALLAVALAGAFAGGYLLKGKSGWCSSICPLLPIQRVYGQAPFATVPNDHCRPCVGCTKNCYDFNPGVAQLVDLHDDDPSWGALRKLFAGALPGLVLGFFTASSTDEAAEHVTRMLLAVAASAGSFLAAEALLHVSIPKLGAAYGAAAINLFYWWAAPILATTLTGDAAAWIVWPVRIAVLALSILWLRRVARREAAFRRMLVAASTHAEVTLRSAPRAAPGAEHDAEVTFEEGGPRVVTKAGTPLLDIAETAGQPIEAGCRMGVCGADPVGIVAGMDHLSALTDDERGTLERLGLDPDLNRMACCARVHGSVTVSLKPDRQPTVSTAVAFDFDPDVNRVVVIGNGIGGVTVADHVRRRHPDCTIDLVAAEPHPLYNRMGISRLIYGRSAMVGLYLLPDTWYDDHRISCWLNTRALRVDRAARTVHLGTGETLEYDRLVLATGSDAFVPSIPGFGLRGTFVLRTAEDALSIRAHLQVAQARRAVVAGGGLLGLEAAYALHKVGMRTTVVERGPWLLRRQLDQRAGEFLQTYLHNLGIELLLGASTAGLRGGACLTEVLLTDETVLPADLFLVAAGVRPTIGLADTAGLATKRGVVVDEHLRSSDPDIFAVGDAAERDGVVLGLWPVAVEQAEVAAENSVGGKLEYSGSPPVTMLKVVGVEMLSVGLIEPPPAGSTFVVEETATLRYAKLVVDDERRLVGAILLGYPQHNTAVTAAVKARSRLDEVIEELGWRGSGTQHV
jgi:NADPH-dependent 2,4-dienoyl-CoA reductase/sulfur reductase-like enzyme/ferredoxin